jgi:hypothetical protein
MMVHALLMRKTPYFIIPNIVTNEFIEWLKYQGMI